MENKLKSAQDDAMVKQNDLKEQIIKLKEETKKIKKINKQNEEDIKNSLMEKYKIKIQEMEEKLNAKIEEFKNDILSYI